MTKVTFLLVLLAYCQLGCSQIKRPQTKQEIIAICGKFMDSYKIGKYADAFQGIKPYTAIEGYKLDTMSRTVTRQMEGVRSYYGKTLSYEEVSEKEVKNSLIKLVYLAKLEKFYLKFIFILYNNGSGWAITGFDYNEKIDDLF